MTICATIRITYQNILDVHSQLNSLQNNKVLFEQELEFLRNSGSADTTNEFPELEELKASLAMQQGTFENLQRQFDNACGAQFTWKETHATDDKVETDQQAYLKSLDTHVLTNREFYSGEKSSLLNRNISYIGDIQAQHATHLAKLDTELKSLLEEQDHIAQEQTGMVGLTGLLTQQEIRDTQNKELREIKKLNADLDHVKDRLVEQKIICHLLSYEPRVEQNKRVEQITSLLLRGISDCFVSVDSEVQLNAHLLHLRQVLADG